MGNLFGVLLIAMLVGPILMAVAGWKMVGSTHSPMTAAGLSKDSIAAILVGVAIVIFAVGIGMAYTVPDYFTALYFRRSLLREIRRRPNHLVNAGDPNALFLEVHTLEGSGYVLPARTKDIGLLLVDQENCKILFEGDKECYRIPGAALGSCKVLEHIGTGRADGIAFYLVLVLAYNSKGSWEIGFAQPGNSGAARNKSRAKWAGDLCRKIQAIIPKQP